MAGTKDAYWFPHDANARNDRALIRLVSRYGERSGWYYWCTIEYLRELPGYKLPEEDVDLLADGIRADVDVTREFLKAAIALDLIVLEGGNYYSESLIERMKPWDAKRKLLRRIASDGGKASAAKRRAKKKDDKVLPPPKVPYAEPPVEPYGTLRTDITNKQPAESEKKRGGAKTLKSVTDRLLSTYPSDENPEDD